MGSNLVASSPGAATLATYLQGTIVLVAVIVIATLLNIGLFQFGAHPRRIAYLGTYLVVLAGTSAIMIWHHRQAAGSPALRAASARTVDRLR